MVSAAAISIAPCGHRRDRIDCPLWCPPRQYLLLLVVAAAVLSMAPCGFRRGIIDGSLWSPPRPYRSLLAVAAVAILMIYFDEGVVSKALCLFEVLLFLSLFRYCDASNGGIGAGLGPTDEDAVRRRRIWSWYTRVGRRSCVFRWRRGFEVRQ